MEDFWKMKKEFWLAWELMLALKYSKWKNFIIVIDKAKVACEANNAKAIISRLNSSGNT